MGFLSGPQISAPPAPPPLPPAAMPATMANAQVSQAAANQRAAAAAASGAGYGDTLKTGPQGVMGKPTTAAKSLTGQ
jgi:hypothetical protein